MDLFLPYPFAAPDVVATLLGAGLAPTAARLEGYAIRQDQSGMRVALTPAPGSTVLGVLVSCDPGQVERASFVMAAFGARPTGVKASVGTDRRTATAHVAEADGLACEAEAEGWGGDRLELLAEIVAELGSHLGNREPEHLPALMHGVGFRALARMRGRALRTPSRLRHVHEASDVEMLAQRNGYAKYFAVEELEVRHVRFDGTMSGSLDRAVLASGDGVTVLPFDPVRGTVLLIEQFRAGALVRQERNPWFLETIAGRCDRLEPVEETARREALEEAGLTLGRLERAAGYYTSPGVSAEYITAFVAEADLAEADGVFGLAQEGEDIRALVMPLDEAIAAIATGEINNAPLMLSLLWLERNRSRLQRAWDASSAA